MAPIAVHSLLLLTISIVLIWMNSLKIANGRFQPGKNIIWHFFPIIPSTSLILDTECGNVIDYRVCDTNLHRTGPICGNKTECYYAHLNFCFLYCCDNEEDCLFIDRLECEQSCILPEGLSVGPRVFP